MGLSKVLVGVTGAAIAISGVTAVAIRGGGDDTPSKRPAASVHSNADATLPAPVASGTDPAGSAAQNAVTSPSTVPPAAQATPAVPVPTPAGTSAAAPVPSAQEVVDSVSQLMNQLKQSANNNGAPQPVSKDQVDQAIADMLAKLGVNSK